MEAAEYYELIIGMTELYNSLFEFWLTITFAFLVTVHFTFHDIDLGFKRLVLSIYGAAAILFLFRWVLAVQGVLRIGEKINEAGIPPPPFSPDTWQTLAAYSAVFVLMLIGTIMSLYFGVKKGAGT